MPIILNSLEAETTEEVISVLGPHFTLRSEVEGTHILGRKKRIDFVLFPKEHLTEFPQVPIGLELKPKQLFDGNKKQWIHLAEQALDYRYTKFNLGSEFTFLPLILVYPPCENYTALQRETFSDGFHYFSSRFLGRKAIGELVLNDPKYEFKILLCGDNYYRYGNNGFSKRQSDFSFERYQETKNPSLLGI